MARKILIATLGTTPAVVTEALDLLGEQGLQMDGVVLVMTRDPEVLQSYKILCRHLPAHDGIDHVEPVTVKAYDDVHTAEAVVDFLQQACDVLKRYRAMGYERYVSIAGGRKAMSALLTLAVQFYGAERLFHVWVPPWLEDDGHVQNFRSVSDYPDAVTAKLHPSLHTEATDRPQLVDLPFVGLFSLLGDLLDGLRGAPVARHVEDLLRRNGLVDSSGEPTPLGQQVARVLERVESVPPPRPEPYRVHIPPHHHQRELRELAERLAERLPFVREVRSVEWSAGGARVKMEGLNLVNVFVPAKSGVRLGLQLVTTARTPGELETARAAVEKALDSML